MDASDNKYASEYPLPGGVEKYFDTLVELLRFVRDQRVAADEMMAWFFETFPAATGQIAVNGYIATVGRMNLWSEQEGVYRLTADGTLVVGTAETDPAGARRRLFDIKNRVFLGYDLLMGWLVEASRTLDELHVALKSALGLNWQSKNQTTFRVNWIRSLGYVVKEGRNYCLTAAGRAVASELRAGQPADPTRSLRDSAGVREGHKSSLVQQAGDISDRLERAAISGGTGKDLEEAVAAAFQFLGFDVELIGGSGNPDVLATAAMGERSYRLLLEAKSRASGSLQQNDVNFQALEKQKQNASAQFVSVVAVSFSSGNLEEFAVKSGVRLIATSDIRELLLAHAVSALPLDKFRPFFEGSGATNEGVLSDVLSVSESGSEVMLLARKVFSAVRGFQDKAGAINAHSLYYIMKCEHSLPTIRFTLDFLKSELIGALGETDGQSLFTRISSQTLQNKLLQITQMLDLAAVPST